MCDCVYVCVHVYVRVSNCVFVLVYVCCVCMYISLCVRGGVCKLNVMIIATIVRPLAGAISRECFVCTHVSMCVCVCVPARKSPRRLKIVLQLAGAISISNAVHSTKGCRIFHLHQCRICVRVYVNLQIIHLLKIIFRKSATSNQIILWLIHEKCHADKYIL